MKTEITINIYGKETNEVRCYLKKVNFVIFFFHVIFFFFFSIMLFAIFFFSEIPVIFKELEIERLKERKREKSRKKNIYICACVSLLITRNTNYIYSKKN